MSKQVLHEPTELRAFHYDTVAASIDGLLFNVDRDLQRRIVTHHTAGERVTARSVEMTLMFLRYAKIAYNAVRYLTADTPPDPARKPVYAVIIPNVNRQLIDILSTLVFMLDDLVPRHSWYERSGYRGMREQYDLYNKTYASDPVWQTYLKGLAGAIVKAAQDLNISAGDQQDPSQIRYWPTPNQMNKRIKTKSQDFLRCLITWLWGNTSEQAHFACNGMFTLAPYIYGDLLNEKDREHVNDRMIHQYHYEHFSRTVILSLAIATEIDHYFDLNNKPQLSGIWMSLIKGTEIPGVESETKEMYDMRYRNFLEHAP
jgi:hypothetical protein